MSRSQGVNARGSVASASALNLESALPWWGPAARGKAPCSGVANGLIQPTSGSVQWFGEPRLRRRLRSRIGTLWQDLRLIEGLSVQHNLNTGRLAAWSWWQLLLNLLQPLESRACAEALAQVELDASLLPLPLSALSGGQRQRVALARLLRQNAELLLADEPLAQLDPPLARRLLQLLLGLATPPRGLLMSLHRPDWLEGFDRVVGLRHGELVFDRPPEAVSAADLEQLYS